MAQRPQGTPAGEQARGSSISTPRLAASGRFAKAPPPPAPRVARSSLILELVVVLLLAFGPAALADVSTLLAPSTHSGTPSAIGPASLALVQEGLFAWLPIAVIFLVLRRSGEGAHTLGLRPWRWSDLWSGIALVPVSFIVVFLGELVFRGLGVRNVTFLPKALPVWFLILTAVFIAVTAGVTEEIVVRGYAQTRLQQLRASWLVVLILPTALWASLHIYEGGQAPPVIFLLGLVYAIWNYRTRRLLPTIIAHGLYDFIALMTLLPH